MEFSKKLRKYANKSGADLVGALPVESIDSVPTHWVGWTVNAFTRKSKNYMEDAVSALVLGYSAWDDFHEIALLNNGVIEYSAYQRMRLFARRTLRFIQDNGYKAVIYPELLSQKKMAQLAGFGGFGKNSLIVNPKYGPWIRIQSILTNAELVYDEPFEEDLCGVCDKCLHACPVNALTPYKVDPEKCIVGMYYPGRKIVPEFEQEFKDFMPKLTKYSRLMCTECQKACPYGSQAFK
jgi:ferredoxin